jgi:hypothetical protein
MPPAAWIRLNTVPLESILYQLFMLSFYNPKWVMLLKIDRQLERDRDMAGDGPINIHNFFLMDHDLIGSEPLNTKTFF